MNSDEAPGGDSSWYFVDEKIKDRLASGNGLPFSVASLFAASTSTQQTAPPPPPLADALLPRQHTGLPTSSIWKKEQFFVLQPSDERLTITRKFFHLATPDSSQYAKTRREVNHIVLNKFKRVERNQKRFTKQGPKNNYARKKKFAKHHRQ